MSLSPRLLLLSLLLVSGLSAGVDPWSQLKVGMSPQDAAKLVGEPLFRRQGKGFQMWTYDGGAEVLLYVTSGVVGWTAPVSAKVGARSDDVWNQRKPGVYYATLFSGLPAVNFKAIDDLKPSKREPFRELAGAGPEYPQFLRDGKG